MAPASVTEMLRKLEDEGYVRHSLYRGTTLTADGLREAQRVTRKHRLLERFLSDVLRIPMDQVHSQACEMEHALSDEAAESMCRLLKHPDRCPDDGQVIPACDLPYSDCDQCMEAEKEGPPRHARKRKESLFPLSSLEPGASGRVTFIRGERRFLDRLGAIGLAPGVHVRATTNRPSTGRMEVSVGGSKVAIGEGVAAAVFVKVTTRDRR